MRRSDLQAKLEAVLFASGDPVCMEDLAQGLDCTTEELIETSKELMDAYRYEQHGLRLLSLDDSLQLVTAPEYAEEIQGILHTKKPGRLSRSALEVLSIIAYYQPTTKTYIEQVRGVDSGYSLGSLLDRDLIEDCGRLEVPGRPILYRTSKDFLRVFGLASLD